MMRRGGDKTKTKTNSKTWGEKTSKNSSPHVGHHILREEIHDVHYWFTIRNSIQKIPMQW